MKKFVALQQKCLAIAMEGRHNSINVAVQHPCNPLFLFCFNLPFRRFS